MSKVTLQDVTSLTNEQSALVNLNSNSAVIETAFDNTLSRDGTAPNQMEADLDMNSKRILNLIAPISSTEPLRLADIGSIGAVAVLKPSVTTDKSLVRWNGTTGAGIQNSVDTVSDTGALLIPGSYNGSRWGFFSNHNSLDGNVANAVINQFNDRLFVGSAADYSGVFPSPQNATTWLDRANPAPQSLAQFATMSRYGYLGLLAASRTSDGGPAGVQNCIGASVWALNDNSSQVQYAYGLYTAGRRYAGAGWTASQEVEISNAGTTEIVGPYGAYTPNATIGIWLESGGGWGPESGFLNFPWAPGATSTVSTNTSCALAIVANGTRFDKGIIFGKNSLVGTDGATGTSTAIVMAKGHDVEWWRDNSGIGTAAGRIRSNATATSGQLTFSNGAVEIKDITDSTTWLSVSSTGTVSSSLKMTKATRSYLLGRGDTDSHIGGFALYSPGTDGSVVILTNANSTGAVVDGVILLGGHGNFDSQIISLSASGAIKSTSTSGGVGYDTGAGGLVSQGTSKATGVTLNKVCGQITMNGAALAAQTEVSFTLTNSSIAAKDIIIVNIVSGATANSYIASVGAVAAGSCVIQLANITAATSLSEAVVLGFAIIKAVTT